MVSLILNMVLGEQALWAIYYPPPTSSPGSTFKIQMARLFCPEILDNLAQQACAWFKTSQATLSPRPEVNVESHRARGVPRSLPAPGPPDALILPFCAKDALLMLCRAAQIPLPLLVSEPDLITGPFSLVFCALQRIKLAKWIKVITENM